MRYYINLCIGVEIKKWSHSGTEQMRWWGAGVDSTPNPKDFLRVICITLISTNHSD